MPDLSDFGSDSKMTQRNDSESLLRKLAQKDDPEK
jgi:hypothetical protein